MSGHDHVGAGLTRDNLRFQRLVLGAGAILMAVKFIAWILTGSNAIFSDALESIVNIAAGLLALVSLTIAALPNDRNHPYGHGKIEFISAGIEGTMIGLAGLAAIIKAGYNLIYPQQLSNLDWGLILSAVAGMVNYGMGWASRKAGEKSHSMALVASGKHLQSDAYSTIGLLIGLSLVLVTDLIWLDNAVAIVFGGIIIWTGIGVIRHALAALMDESDFDLISQVLNAIKRHRAPEWIDLHNFRVMRVGSAIHIDCHLTLPWYQVLREAHQHIHALEDALRLEFDGQNLECFIHADACVPASCPLCPIKECPVRQSPFVEPVDWTLEQVMGTEKHRLSR